MSISVQCPRCSGAVSVADQAAGQRVKCPHCDETFLAPGISVEEKDDDDWLSLDDVPLTPSPPGVSEGVASDKGKDSDEFVTPLTNTSPPRRSGTDRTPSLSPDDEALLAEFTEDVDEFTAQVESPPKPHPSAASPTSASGGPKGTPGGSTPKSPDPKPATPTEYATEYRVKCNICGTFIYAKAQQAGQTVKCPDCFSPMTIPPPPKVSKGVKVNVENAETFQFEDTKVSSRGPDPYKRSAEQLLEEASREEDTDTSPTYGDVPSVKEWVLKVFSIFKDLGVLAHWLALSALAGIPAALALHSEQPVLMLALFPAGFFLGVLVVSSGFAIMHAVANEEETVTDWPTLDPFNWLSQLLMVVAAAALVVVPIWMVCMLILGPSLLSLALTMLSVYVLFPFVLLSMLDMNSMMIPFSAELARSVTKSEEAWGGFYFSSGLLFAGLFLLFVIVNSMGPAAAALIGVTATVGVAFAYFAMLGRLAFAIGQTVNAPPRVDDVDRTRHNEVS